MKQIRLSPLEIRIVAILKDWYPITVAELKDELSLRQTELDRALKSLMVKGIVALEPLSDKSFIRLLTPDVQLEPAGRKERKRPPKPPEPEDSIMYG